jgi:predicted DNA-binding transcriptional regulator AlpA
MWQAGKFPKPFQLSTNGWNCWAEDEIDAWLEERAGRRSTAQNETKQISAAT